MQLIHNDVAQHLRRVLCPQLAVLWPDQQVVEHLVVGQQNIWWIATKGFTVGNHLLGRHANFAAAVLAGHAAHIKAHAQAFECRRKRNAFCESRGLVGGKCIHRVDDQCLHTAVAASFGPHTVIQHRIQEALRLAASGAGGDDCGLGHSI